MKHRHIRAKRGEWIHVHRDDGFGGCLGGIIFLAVIILIFKGC